MHDSLCYINILTYLLTYLHNKMGESVVPFSRYNEEKATSRSRSNDNQAPFSLRCLQSSVHRRRPNVVSMCAGSIVNAFPSHKSSCSTSRQKTLRSVIANARIKGKISDPGWSFTLGESAAGAVFLRTGCVRVFHWYITRNSSGDEIANVNFLYDDIVHVLQNTIDLCINSPQIDTAVMCWNVCLPNSVK